MLVDVCGNDKCVILFEKAGGEFVADAVGFLRRDLTGQKGLPDLISKHLALSGTASNITVLAF